MLRAAECVHHDLTDVLLLILLAPRFFFQNELTDTIELELCFRLDHRDDELR